MSNDDTAQARIKFLHGLRAVHQLCSEPLPKEVVDEVLDVARFSISPGYPDEEARRARPKFENARKPLATIVH